MRSFWKIAVAVLLALLAMAAGSCGSEKTAAPNPGTNVVPAEIESLAQAVTRDLTGQGYEVARGYFELFTIEDCDYAIRVIGTCAGNNPVAPYAIPVVPTWGDEYVDPATTNLFGPTAARYSASWRFDPREAVLVIGRLPPPARYFSYETYQFTHVGQIDTTSPPYQFLSQFPATLPTFFGLSQSGRVLSLASISDSINNVVIDRQSGASFGEDRVIISTPDQGMDAALRASLARAGVPAPHVFTEPIPSTTTTLGVGAAADDFFTLIRYSMPANSEQGNTWREQLPLVLLRVRSRDSVRPAKPYPPFVLAGTRTSEDETGLAADLDALKENVRAAWGLPPGASPPQLSDRMLDTQRSVPINLSGPRCIENTMNCLADNWDTSYMATFNLPLESQGGRILYAIVGTLGTRTGNATYSALSVNYARVLKGLLNVSDPDLERSQASFPQGPTPFKNGEKLFLWYVGRSCERVTGGNCTAIPESSVPLNEPIKMILRNYVHPGTPRGPNTEPAGDPTGQSPLLTPWIVSIPLGAS